MSDKDKMAKYRTEIQQVSQGRRVLFVVSCGRSFIMIRGRRKRRIREVDAVARHYPSVA